MNAYETSLNSGVEIYQASGWKYEFLLNHIMKKHILMNVNNSLCICVVRMAHVLLSRRNVSRDEVYLGLVVTKPVFGVSDKARFKQDCPAIETS